MMLYVRNMESDRCKTIVKVELKKLGIVYKSVELGEVEVSENIPEAKMQMLDMALRKSGLELIVNNKMLLILKIKEAVKLMVYSSDEIFRPNSSSYISQRVNYDYNCLSKIFSEIEGITIEKYIISQRIERAKELMVQGAYSLSEISFKMLYSSVAHLSNQFKKVTGLTPFNFRKLMEKQSGNTVNV